MNCFLCQRIWWSFVFAVSIRSTVHSSKIGMKSDLEYNTPIASNVFAGAWSRLTATANHYWHYLCYLRYSYYIVFYVILCHYMLFCIILYYFMLFCNWKYFTIRHRTENYWMWWLAPLFDDDTNKEKSPRNGDLIFQWQISITIQHVLQYDAIDDI